MTRMIILCQSFLSSVKTKAERNRDLVNSNSEADDFDEQGRPKIAASDANGQVFDVSYYKRVKEATISPEAKRVLQKPLDTRTDVQVKAVLTSLNDCVPEFRDFPVDMQKKIIRVSLLQEFEPGRIIIRQNHKADNFYFIVSGITAVSVSDRNPITGEFQSHVVAFLPKGKSFGELALMHGAKRNATVTCHTDVSVLSIDRCDFVDIFMHIESGKEPEHVSFLRKIHLLVEWPIDKLPFNDPRVSLLTFYRKNAVICREGGKKNEWIYFIRQGSCRIIKKINLLAKPLLAASENTTTNSSGANSGTNRSIASIFGKSESNSLAAPSALSSELNYMEDQKKKKKKLVTNKTAFIEIKKLVSKDIFGIVELLYDESECETNVSVISDGVECILLNKSFFLAHLSQRAKKNLKEKIQPYPSERELQNKFLVNDDWNEFRRKQALTLSH